MRLSIVIVNWNTSSLLEALVDSIEKWPPPFAYETIVIDNASSDFDSAGFTARHPDVKLTVNATNKGYAEGNNQGIEVSTGKHILLLNPDTEVTDGAIEELFRFTEEHPEAAAVGARLVRPDGTVDRSVRSFPYPGPIAWEFLGLSRLFPGSRIFGRYRMTYFEYNKTEEVDQPMGSCLMLSRAALDEIGAFDTQFPIFFNEVDWLYRAKVAGYKAYFDADATVIHHGAASTSQVNKTRMIRESHDSLIRFYKKHFRNQLAPPVYWFALACIYLGRFVRG